MSAAPIDRPSLWLGGGIALTLALAAWPWLASTDSLGVAPMEPFQITVPLALPAPMPALETLTQTRQRPLFAPDRRVQPVAALPPGIGHRLVGIVGIADTLRAVLATGQGTRTLGVGDTVEGWSVQAIEAERLVLSRGGDRHILMLGGAMPPAQGQGGNQ